MEKKSEILPLKELVKMLMGFVGKEWKTYTKQQKMEWITKYREVEYNHNKQIAKYGSVEAWYLSGEGRLMEF